MNLQDYKSLANATAKKVRVEDLDNKTPRTLLYGYTSERHTLHVYLGDDQNIHVLVYQDTVEVSYLNFSQSAEKSNNRLIPDKRLYPESCDFEMCRELLNHGENLPFTTFTEGADERRKQGGQFAGLRLEEMSSSVTPVELPVVLGDYTSNLEYKRQAVAKAALELRVFCSAQDTRVLLDRGHAKAVLEMAEGYLAEASPRMSSLVFDQEDLDSLLRDEFKVYDSLSLTFGKDCGTLCAMFQTGTALDESYLKSVGLTPVRLTDNVILLDTHSSDTPLRALRDVTRGASPAEFEYLFFEGQIGSRDAFIREVSLRG